MRNEGKKTNPCFRQLCTSEPSTKGTSHITVIPDPPYKRALAWLSSLHFHLRYGRSRSRQLTSSPPLYFFLMLLRSMALWSLVDLRQKFVAKAAKRGPTGLVSNGPTILNKFALSVRLMVVMSQT